MAGIFFALKRFRNKKPYIFATDYQSLYFTSHP